MNRHTQGRKGFTLIEIMVVVAIIGILIAIVLASVGGARSVARDGERIADVKTLQIRLEQYRNDKGGYPTQLTALVPSYMPSEPLDPSTRAEYFYNPTCGTTCTTYRLSAHLENMKNATTTYAVVDPYSSLQ